MRGEGPLPLDDHLADIRVPIFYLAAAGGFGDYGNDSAHATASTDVTTHVVRRLAPEREVSDYGHADLLFAHDAPEPAWQPRRLVARSSVTAALARFLAGEVDAARPSSQPVRILYEIVSSAAGMRFSGWRAGADDAAGSEIVHRMRRHTASRSARDRPAAPFLSATAAPGEFFLSG